MIFQLFSKRIRKKNKKHSLYSKLSDVDSVNQSQLIRDGGTNFYYHNILYLEWIFELKKWYRGATIYEHHGWVRRMELKFWKTKERTIISFYLFMETSGRK